MFLLEKENCQKLLRKMGVRIGILTSHVKVLCSVSLKFVEELGASFWTPGQQESHVGYYNPMHFLSTAIGPTYIKRSQNK